MSKTKANFVVDDSFPLIDGVGHSDKIDWVDVKGGGSTNTTNLDPLCPSSHFFLCMTNALHSVSTDVNSVVVHPPFSTDAAGGFGLNNPLCLNAVFQGDNLWSRGSDRILMRRIEVSGSLARRAGQLEFPFGSSSYCPPKVLVGLVLDTQCSGSDLSNDAVFEYGNGYLPSAGTVRSGMPMMLAGVDRSRYRMLAFDLVDFAKSPDGGYLINDSAQEWNSAGFQPDVQSIVVARDHYMYWRDVSFGFRFDVDLNDIICSFNSNSGTVSSVVDNALFLVAFCFDGISGNGYVPNGIGAVDLSFKSRLEFVDWLIPRIPHAPAGADGPVVPPAEDDLDVLADESAKLAGDGPSASKKLRKGDVGAYNFMPRDDDVLMQFPDDPEVARLSVPGTRGSSKGPSRKKFRRYGSYRPKFPFGSFDPYEPGAGERDYKRGKF